MMKFSVLGSGSKGNCIFIESGKTSILIDAGFSGKEIERRMQVIGKRMDDLSALFLTHEHRDHILGAGVLSRRFRLPVFGNHGTITGVEPVIGKAFQFREFTTGDILAVGDLQIRSFSVSHDTTDPVGFVVGNGSVSLACCTDTGRVSRLMEKRLRGCDALILEFNHDPQMLRTGPYSLALQQRVRSDHGHLANEEAAQFLETLQHDHLRQVVLAHLSEANNLPELALKAAQTALRCGGEDTNVRVAGQDEVTGLIALTR